MAMSVQSGVGSAVYVDIKDIRQRPPADILNAVIKSLRQARGEWETDVDNFYIIKNETLHCAVTFDVWSMTSLTVGEVMFRGPRGFFAFWQFRLYKACKALEKHNRQAQYQSLVNQARASMYLGVEKK